jgi:hypothetical protein
MTKTKTEDLLPKIAARGGTVHKQYVRCGKASCKCARGELHGAYYYLFVRLNGKVRKRYLKPDQVEEVRAACQRQRERRRESGRRSREAFKTLRQIRAELRRLGIGVH